MLLNRTSLRSGRATLVALSVGFNKLHKAKSSRTYSGTDGDSLILRRKIDEWSSNVKLDLLTRSELVIHRCHIEAVKVFTLKSCFTFVWIIIFKACSLKSTIPSVHPLVSQSNLSNTGIMKTRQLLLDDSYYRDIK